MTMLKPKDMAERLGVTVRKMKKTIKELRAEKGLTQQQLADELRVDIRSVQYWEAKKYNISKTKRKFIAEVFGVKEEEIDF